MARNAKQRRATTELEDVDVREVSVVDKPAIRRTFLIVKNEDGGLSVVRDFEAEQDAISKQAVPAASASIDEKRKAQKERASRFGIEALENKGERLSFPSDGPTDLNQYGDPVNLKFFFDTPERSRNARVRFKQFANTYTQQKSKAVVHERIVRAELRHKIKPSFDENDPLDKLLSKQIKDQLRNSKETKKMDETALMDRLMALATVVKVETAETISDEACNEFCSIAESLTAKKVDTAIVKQLSPIDAYERIAKAAGQVMFVKTLDIDHDKEFVDIGKEMAPVTVDKGGDAETDETIDLFDGDVKIFVASGDKDPEILIQKAGAKMKRSRLSSFETAVKTLVALLEEIKGEAALNNKDVKKQEINEMGNKTDQKEDSIDKTKADDVTKTEDQAQDSDAKSISDSLEDVSKQMSELITTKLAEFGSKMEEMVKAVKEEVATLTKRVDDLDVENPGSSADGDPEEVEETKKSFWGGRFLG